MQARAGDNTKKRKRARQYKGKKKAIAGEGGGTEASTATAVVVKDEEKEMLAAKRPKIGQQQQITHQQPHRTDASPQTVKAKSPHATDMKFASLGLSANTLRALQSVLGYENATLVQAAAIPVIMTGKDVLAKAKTGTGKTIAFLTPSIEILQRQLPSAGSISVLVLSPTRELACQIRNEAIALLTYHQLKCQHVIGGTGINRERNELTNSRCDILVGTPGRLLDHFESTPGFANKFRGLQILIFDEADLLLEMGFRPSIDKILRYLPRTQDRQTLLFSATLPSELRQITDVALKPTHAFIDTVDPGESNTNIQVDQEVLICQFEKQLPILYHLISEGRKEQDFKILVFFVTARMTQFMAGLFNVAGVPSLEIHSRISQSQRTRASDKFKTGTNLVMFSSDVSARGMDYPDVSLVIQVGLPSNREQYIHRLGRTARAGKLGKGILLLTTFERGFLRFLKDLPINSSPYSDQPDAEFPRANAAIDAGLARVNGDSELRQRAEQAYQAWLGFYNSNLKLMKWDKPTLVEYANAYAGLIGLHETPVLSTKVVGKMGLRGTPGLLTSSEGGGGGRGRQRGGAGPSNGGRGGRGRQGQPQQGQPRQQHQQQGQQYQQQQGQQQGQQYQQQQGQQQGQQYQQQQGQQQGNGGGKGGGRGGQGGRRRGGGGRGGGGNGGGRGGRGASTRGRGI